MANYKLTEKNFTSKSTKHKHVWSKNNSWVMVARGWGSSFGYSSVKDATLLPWSQRNYVEKKGNEKWELPVILTNLLQELSLISNLNMSFSILFLQGNERFVWSCYYVLVSKMKIIREEEETESIDVQVYIY